MQDNQNPYSQPQAPQPQPQAPPTPGPVPPQPYGPQGTPYAMPPQPKSNVGLIIGIVGGVIALVVIIGLVITLTLSGAKKSVSDNNQKPNTPVTTPQVDEPKTPKNAITSTSLTGMSEVCDGASILNAADLAKPYKVAAFYKSEDRTIWSSISLKFDAEYTAKYDSFEQTNVIACLSEDVSQREKVQTCDFTSGGEAISVDYYATSYKFAAYEAKTGKKIEDFGSINAPASKCPTFASYNRSNPILVATPDTATVDAKIAAFAL